MTGPLAGPRLDTHSVPLRGASCFACPRRHLYRPRVAFVIPRGYNRLDSALTPEVEPFLHNTDERIDDALPRLDSACGDLAN